MITKVYKKINCQSNRRLARQNLIMGEKKEEDWEISVSGFKIKCTDRHTFGPLLEKSLSVGHAL